jgi:transcriptional regulator with XRE-family HTH domain
MPDSESSSTSCVSARIIRVIRVRGIRPSLLAERTGLSPSTISQFLAGKRGLHSNSIDRLAAVLGLEIVQVGSRRRNGAVLPRRTFKKKAL